MPGPPPTATAIKLRRGNPGKRALNHEEPKPVPRAPRSPAELTGDALKEYRRITRLLGELRMVASVDLATLVSYATAYARMLEAERHLKDEGCVFTPPDGFPRVNPWLRVSKEAMLELHRGIAALGLSPGARARVHVLADDKAEAADPMRIALKTRSERARAS